MLRRTGAHALLLRGPALGFTLVHNRPRRLLHRSRRGQRLANGRAGLIITSIVRVDQLGSRHGGRKNRRWGQQNKKDGTKKRAADARQSLHETLLENDMT
jgi:hypothetical protein